MQTKPTRFVTKAMTLKYDYFAPDGSEIRLLAAVSGGGLAHCRLPVGRCSSAVRHKTVEEIWFFVSGTGEVWRKLAGVSEVTPVQAGVGLNVPLGTHFQFRNTGETALEFVISTIPRWPGSDEAVPVDGKWISTE